MASGLRAVGVFAFGVFALASGSAKATQRQGYIGQAARRKILKGLGLGWNKFWDSAGSGFEREWVKRSYGENEPSNPDGVGMRDLIDNTGPFKPIWVKHMTPYLATIEQRRIAHGTDGKTRYTLASDGFLRSKTDRRRQQMMKEFEMLPTPDELLAFLKAREAKQPKSN